MSEIDIRDEDEVKVTKIRFSDSGFIRPEQEVVVIDGDRVVNPVRVEKHEVSGLIKALQKYMELYGEKESLKPGVWYNTNDYNQYEIGDAEVMIWWVSGREGGPYRIYCVYGWGGDARMFKVVG